MTTTQIHIVGTITEEIQTVLNEFDADGFIITIYVDVFLFGGRHDVEIKLIPIKNGAEVYLLWDFLNEDISKDFLEDYEKHYVDKICLEYARRAEYIL